MNEWERELAHLELSGEHDTLVEMQGHYQDALARINEKVDALAEREDLSGIRQRRYQEALAKQVGGALDELRSGAYTTLSDYLERSYEQGFVGTMYDLQKQGVPLVFPLDQTAVACAVSMTADDVKLSKRVYDNVGKLQKQVVAEITRGFADAETAGQIAGRIVDRTEIASDIKRNVAGRTNQALRRAMTIARTEKGRVMSEGELAAGRRSKAKGADIVKQWDSTMDARTRPEHVEADGQIREEEDPFLVGGKKGMAPHMFGLARLDVNCRCSCLHRARAALEVGDTYSKWDGENQSYADLSDAKNYEEFRGRYQEVCMSAQSAMIEWPEKGQNMSLEQYKELRTYANDRGVELNSFRRSDADPHATKAMVDAVNKVVSSDDAIAKTLGGKVTLRLSGMHPDDFALVYPSEPNTICLNNQAMRSLSQINEELSSLAKNKYFVEGASAESIIYHELGHMVMLKSGIDPLDVLEEVYGSRGFEALSYVKGEISQYAGLYSDGTELASEAFSAYYSGIENDFAKRYVKAVIRRLE